MVEILSGVLSGAAMGLQVGSIFDAGQPTDTGHFFVAIDIERFQPFEVFTGRLETLLGWLKDSSRLEGVDEIRFPGEIRGRFAKEYGREGIPLAPGTVAALEGLGAELHVPWPGPGAAAEG
jgi:LDH2 family malate/lactate/ureidoglycolate dehydrogenase